MLDISDPAGTADHPGPTRARTTRQRIGTAISGPIARKLPPDVAGVAALTTATASVYTVFEIEQQRHFQTAGYDLGIFDQAIRGYAHLHAPISLMKGVHNGFGTHFSELGDHFSPIIAAVAPVYRVFPSAVTLLVVQGLLFAASLPSVWLFSRRALGRPAAYLITAAYALAWGLQAAMAADFHEIAFAVPLLAIAIERLDAGRLRAAMTAALLLLLVKEDFGLVVALFGLIVGLRTHRWRLAGILAFVGIATTVLADRFLIPAFGGKAGYYWDYYAALGSGPLDAAWHVLRHPLWTLHLMVTPQAKVRLLDLVVRPARLHAAGVVVRAAHVATARRAAAVGQSQPLDADPPIHRATRADPHAGRRRHRRENSPGARTAAINSSADVEQPAPRSCWSTCLDGRACIRDGHPGRCRVGSRPDAVRPAHEERHHAVVAHHKLRPGPAGRG